MEKEKEKQEEEDETLGYPKAKKVKTPRGPRAGLDSYMFKYFSGPFHTPAWPSGVWMKSFVSIGCHLYLLLLLLSRGLWRRRRRKRKT